MNTVPTHLLPQLDNVLMRDARIIAWCKSVPPAHYVALTIHPIFECYEVRSFVMQGPSLVTYTVKQYDHPEYALADFRTMAIDFEVETS